MATVSAVALLLTGCAHSSTPSIAQAPSTTKVSAQAKAQQAHTTSGETSGATALQKYIASEQAFAKCARAQGLNVPDPDANGKQAIPQSVTVELREPSKRKLFAACAHKLLPEPGSVEWPPLDANEFAYQQKLAACMRKHEVPKYPDPVRETDPSLPNVAQHDATINSLYTSAKYQNALDVCTLAVSGKPGNG